MDFFTIVCILFLAYIILGGRKSILNFAIDFGFFILALILLAIMISINEYFSGWAFIEWLSIPIAFYLSYKLSQIVRNKLGLLDSEEINVDSDKSTEEGQKDQSQNQK